MTDSSLEAFSEIKEQLFPGLGFMYDNEYFCLQVDVNAVVDEVDITTILRRKTFLYFAKLKIINDDGDLVLPQNESASEASLQLLRGGLRSEKADEPIDLKLKTERLSRPYIKLKFKKPTFVKKILLYPAKLTPGIRKLRLNGLLRSEQIFSYSNFGDLKALYLLAKISVLAGENAGLSNPSNPGFIALFGAAISRLIESNSLSSLSLLEVAQLLPVFEKEPILTREQIKIAAYIFLRLYSQRAKQGNATQTKLLKPLKQCLWNSSTITQVLHEVNCLNKTWFGSEKYFVLSKHCLHVSRLLANKDKYLDAIDKAVQIFKEIDQDLIVCYGTLLGAVRGKGFIPHDDDIDLLVLCNSQSRDESLVNQQKIFEHLDSRKISYRQKRTGLGFHLRINNVPLGIFGIWEEGADSKLMMERFKYRTVPTSIMKPLSYVELHGRHYPAPHDPAKFLQERYGDSWTIPDPYHEFKWKVKNI